jgi:hypothetical protein
MNTEITTVPTKALTVTQRAIASIGITDEREKELRELAERTTTITTITNKDGYQQVHSARVALKNERIAIQNLAKEARDDANKFSKAVIAEEKRIVGLIQPEETRLQEIQDAYDAKIEAEKQAKIEAELKRVTDLQERVAELRGNQMLTPASGSATIAEHMADLERIPVDESFEEFRQQAEDAKTAGLTRLSELHAAALAHEAEQTRIQEEREELAKLRAEAERRESAERERLAEEERKAKAERDAEVAKQEAELKAQREKQEAEAAAERKRIAEEEAAAKAIRDAEAKKLADERAEFERQQAEVRRAKEESERIERDRARIASLKKPADDELIRVLCDHYQAPESKVVGWLLAIDFSKREAA